MEAWPKKGKLLKEAMVKEFELSPYDDNFKTANKHK